MKWSILLLCIGIVACGDSGQAPQHGLVPESQLRVIERAGEVEGLLQEAGERQRELIEEQTR